MNALAGRAALKAILTEAGASSIWITANVIQASTPNGRQITLIRVRDESHAELITRARAEFERAAAPLLAA